ncbi:hypothetical protein Cgig2_004867 [Carnegiea gigantea]|uniref:Uncharacterized protein n=1 Tax=Carnegiea gigantea TaxID=171969 RepID=A0A9Q1JXY2_9CARY|nr:hypothetical protein Cgig2_004867 [Carnegiea gigantea]
MVAPGMKRACQRFQFFCNKPISIHEKLDVPFFTTEKLGFFEKLLKDNCLGLLNLGDVVYLRLVRLFYVNLETKSTPKSVFFVSLVKSVTITLSRCVLESIFALKFVDTAPSNLTRKHTKDLCLTEFACPHKIADYKRQNKAPPLKKDHADLCNQLDHIQLEMGLMNKKIDVLFRLTSLLHRGAQLAVPFQTTDVVHATPSTEQIIQSTSSAPHFG